MKTFYKCILLCLFFNLIETKVKAQFTTFMIDAKLLDSGSTKCKPPYSQAFQIFLSAYGYAGSSSYDTVVYYLDFGDGVTQLVKRPLYRSTVGLGIPPKIAEFYYSYKVTGTFNATVAITSLTTGATDTVRLPTVVFGDSCTTFVGKLYTDANKNCLADAGELGLNWVPIRAINTATGDTTMAVDWTDTAGYFDFKMPAGSYILTPLTDRATISYSTPKDTLSSFCPASGSKTITVLPFSTYTTDFAYECKPNTNFDAAINILSNGFVPGDTSLMCVYTGSLLEHSGCVGRDVTISVTLDTVLTYVGVYDGNIPSVSGKVLTYTLVDADISNFKSMLLISTDTAAKLGDTVCTTATITAATGYPDPDMSNNLFNHCRAVAASFDPNIKEVSPLGVGNEGFIPPKTPLNYTIHFQNTGTTFARNIVIADTLESDLEGSSLHIIGSSHNMTVKKTGDIVNFNFKNIFLPDSGASYYGSMGFVTYRILPKADLAPGTEIKNRAGIFFDFNDPILTNYTLNTIEFPTRIQHVFLGNLSVAVYPNPANSELNIRTDNITAFSVTLMDLLGRTIDAQRTKNGHVVIETQNVPTGLYLLNIRDGHGRELNTKVQVQH